MLIELVLAQRLSPHIVLPINRIPEAYHISQMIRVQQSNYFPPMQYPDSKLSEYRVAAFITDARLAALDFDLDQAVSRFQWWRIFCLRTFQLRCISVSFSRLWWNTD